MKGIWQWFKASSKLKRWFFVITLGLLCICYGITKILVMKEMSFFDLITIIFLFVVGVLTTVLGLVSLNKRVLEILIESTDERMKNNKKNVNVKSLIYNKKVYDQGPKIVVIGGGTGLNTVLAGLKKYTNNLTAIVTVSDYGEKKLYSNNELNLEPLNDVKESIIALSENEKQLRNLFDFQFKDGRLSGLNFSDIYFSTMKNININFAESVIKSNEVLKIIGKVLPVTLDKMTINAELENGYVVSEKSKIPEVVYNKVTKINRIFLKPTNCRPAPGVIDAIKNADCVIIGPGSLYTNVIPNLLVNGVARAIKESSALKVYLSNIMTEPGQTDEYSVSDHVKAIVEHCGKGIIDYCIYDTGEVIPEYIKKYNLEGQDLVDANTDKVKGIKFLQRNLSTITNEFIRHDSDMVAKSIIELICDDLRFQDKQSDPQYLMLNNKLREDKRINRIKKQSNRNMKKGKKDNKKKNSKFLSKYSERINSIKQSNEMAKLKEQRYKKEKNKKVKYVEDEQVLEFRKEYEKTIMGLTKKPSKTSAATAIRKKDSPQEIREKMLKKLRESKL